MELAIAGLVFLTVTSLCMAVGAHRQYKSVVVSRLNQFKSQRASEEIVLPKESLSQRLLQPLLHYLSQAATSHTPQQVKDNLRKQLLMAGSPGNLQASEFMALKILISLIVLAISFILPMGLLAKIGLVLVAWFAPNLYLRQRVQQRQAEIAYGIPDMLDLLTVSVEAGLGFDSAIAKVVEKTKGPLAEEFQRMLQEIRMGKPRRDALRNLSIRTGVGDLQGFVAAIVQADQLGVSIGKVLRIQSVEIRRKRRQRAEEAAMKAPIKMLFPLVIFVFPALFIILLGPALLKFMEAF